MERREFLIRLALAAAATPAALSLVGCGGDGGNGSGSMPGPMSPGNAPISPVAATPTSRPGATATPSSGTPVASRTPTASPTPMTERMDFTVTSTVVGGHTHDITVLASDLAAGTGVTYTSTMAFGHSHTVTLTPEIISDLNAGGMDTVTSNPDDTGHSHDWMIMEP